MKVVRFTTYTKEIADACRALLIDLSRSGKDKGEIPESWFKEIAASPYHDLLLAESDDGQILGMATLSVVMGAGIKKNAYLEDFVTAASARGQGVGTALWEEMLVWAKEKGCNNLEFTCGNGREASQQFYKNHGATIYDTNFFRRQI
jgi:GNAT superfamily N-acetyltransferase